MPQEQILLFKQQIMWTIVAVFVAMTASIIVSTIVVTQILGKQVAATQSTAPVVYQTPATPVVYEQVVGCVEGETAYSEGKGAPVREYGGYGVAPKHQPAKFHGKHHVKKQVSVKSTKTVNNVKTINNTTKTSTKTVNINSGNIVGSFNKETNTNVAVTKISDSFNKDSYNQTTTTNTAIVNKDSFNTEITKDSYNSSVEVKETNINSHNDNSQKTVNSNNDNSKTKNVNVDKSKHSNKIVNNKGVVVAKQES
jgi:hypothetical protein